MKRFLKYGVLLSLSWSPLAGRAQDEREKAEADLNKIRTAALEFPGGGIDLDSFRQRLKSLNNEADQQQELISAMGRVGRSGQPLSLPFRIRAPFEVSLAQRRAQYMMQVLSADLNGDLVVSLAELKETISIGITNGAAETFLAGDTNSDNVLDQTELRFAVEQQAEADIGRNREESSPLEILDFDKDGYLSAEELERAIKALTL